MSRKHQLTRRFGRWTNAVLVLGALGAAGCADINAWWNEQFGQKPAAKQQKAETTEAGAVEIAREAPETSPEVASADTEPKSPDALETRIREYVRDFPADDDTRKIHAPPPEEGRPAEETIAAGETSRSTTTSPPGGPVAKPESPEPAKTAGQTASGELAAGPAESASPGSGRPAIPVVRSVAVRPTAGEATPGTESQPPETAQVNQPLRVQPPAEPGIDATVDQLKRAVEQQPDDMNSQLRLRMLYLAQGEEDKALSPVAGVNREMADMVQGLMEVVVASREAAADPTAKADDVLEAVNAYRDMIKDYADLQVPKVALCTEAISFGVYKPFPADRLVAGQAMPVVVYAEVKYFTSKRTAEQQYQTLLSWQVEVLDADGKSVATLSDKPFEDVSTNRREDFFLADIVHLPADLKPGDYTLRVQIEDRNSGRFSSGSTKFTMRAAGG